MSSQSRAPFGPSDKGLLFYGLEACHYHGLQECRGGTAESGEIREVTPEEEIPQARMPNSSSTCTLSNIPLSMLSIP